MYIVNSPPHFLTISCLLSIIESAIMKKVFFRFSFSFGVKSLVEELFTEQLRRVPIMLSSAKLR